MSAGDFAFGATVLSTSPYSVVDLDIAGPPAQLLTLPLAVREGSLVSHQRHGARVITLTGKVAAASKSALETAYDSLLKALNSGEQNLKIGREDERYFRARLTEEVWVEGRWLRLLTYRARFLAADPFAYAAAELDETDNTALSSDGGGSYHKDIEVAPAGSIYSRPRFQIVVPAATAYGITSITIRNVTIPQAVALVVTRNFVASDTLIVDSSDFSVTVNGDQVDYSGAFPLFDPRDGATNDIRVTALASATPTLNCTFEWTPRFL